MLAAGATSAAGLDHSPDMLALSMERNREAVATEALHLKLGDATRIPWPDRTFTAALAANMFFFVEEPELVLSELFPRVGRWRSTGDRHHGHPAAGTQPGLSPHSELSDSGSEHRAPPAGTASSLSLTAWNAAALDVPECRSARCVWGR